jgi:predicted transcriptional regulator
LSNYAYFNNGDEATSIALEMGTNLRQPEKQQRKAAEEAQEKIERLK